MYECVRNQDEEGPAFEILVASPHGLGRSQLRVDFGSPYDRQRHPDGDLEISIEKTWMERLHKNPSLFNGMKFRYGGYRYVHSRNGAGDDVCLCLGLTDYKTFVGTNLSPNWNAFLSLSNDDIQRCKHMSSPLGNGAIVETKDEHIVVLKRSEHVGEFPGHLVFPGGHSEPQEVGISGHNDMHGNPDLNTKVADEMFTGIVREIVEETGILASYLSKPLFLGISRRCLNARPTAFFYTKCELSSPDILRLYQQAPHKFESTQLLTVTKDELSAAAAQMPGCHQGGAALFALSR